MYYLLNNSYLNKILMLYVYASMTNKAMLVDRNVVIKTNYCMWIIWGTLSKLLFINVFFVQNWLTMLQLFQTCCSLLDPRINRYTYFSSVCGVLLHGNNSKHISIWDEALFIKIEKLVTNLLWIFTLITFAYVSLLYLFIINI